MMNGPIQRTLLHRVESRSDVRLPMAWIGGASPAAGWSDGTWLTRGAARSASLGAGPVLVLWGDSWADAGPALLAYAATGARVYALVGPSWSMELDSQVLEASRVLVRRVPEVPINGVLAGREAHVRIGGGLVLRLDDSQTEGLRQTFLRLFWHEATEEAWSGGRKLAWQPARERPFDVPAAPASASVRLERPDARLLGDARDALMHLTGGLPPEAAPRRLWFPAGPEHHDRLARLARAGVEVVWEDRGLPDVLVAGGVAEVLFPGARRRLRLRLTAGQAGELGRMLETGATWRFQTDIRLGDAGLTSAIIWLPGEAAARGLEVEQLIEAPDVHATSLLAVPDTAPASLPPGQPLALAVRYQWTVIPPRVPSGTEEDILVARWRKLDEDWIQRLAHVRKALEASNGERGRIGRAFSRLVSAMLGFERTHGGLLARLAELESKVPSRLGPTGAPALIAQLSELEEAARSHQVDLEQAERGALQDEEREKQHAAWQARVDAAERDLPDRRTALEAAELQRTTVTHELQTVERALRSADKEAKKDLLARRLKLVDDLQRAKKQVERLNGEIRALESAATDAFEFRLPPTTKGRPPQPDGRFIPPTSSARPASQVPDEALPDAGALRSQKGQRYLVIQTWEDLAAGEKTASRLSAKLVAPENA